MLKIIIILFVLLFNFMSCQTDEEVDYYLNLINEADAEGESYEFPTNANEYMSVRNEYSSFGSFDFIIVGGGAAGSVVARRLSDNSSVTVLLIDAGGFANNLSSIPAMGSPQQLLLRNWNWGYKSVPQETVCLGVNNRQCIIPRGKGIGGSTLVNGLLNARGGSADFNNWSNLGNPGWSYDEVLPLFKKIEHFDKNDPEAHVEPFYHGYSGPVNVDYTRPRHTKTTIFLDAHREIGSKTLDYNGKNLIGASAPQEATKNGRRVDAGTAYVKPVLNRSNLKVLTEAYVSKITFHKTSPTTASGVIFSHSHQLFSATAKKEVILSSGSIGSPQILMLSGIGPESHLKSLDISLVQNLEVGSKLKEHPMFFGLTLRSNLSNNFPSLRDQVKEFLKGEGALTIPGTNYGLSFFALEDNVNNHAKIEFVLNMGQYQQTRKLVQKAFQWTDDTYETLFGGNFRDGQGLPICLILLHEESSGTIRLKSNDPYEYPLINPNLLSDRGNRDLHVLYEGIQVMQKLLQTEAFRKINASLPGKHPACKQYKLDSREYWFCALRQETQTVYHPVSTCPMGPDPKKGAVVNHQLKVHGVNNLRVADASIFPTTLSGHPSFPCMMVGEFVSNLIKEEYKL